MSSFLLQDCYHMINFMSSTSLIMNVHPIIVHFPIACLMLYCMLEIAYCFFPKSRLQKLETTKLFLLWVGTVGTFFALQSWEVAQEIVWGQTDLIHTHEEFAEKTYSLFLVLSIIRLVFVIHTHQLRTRFVPATLTRFITTLRAWRATRWIIALGACAGIVLLTITWALGGAITRGPDADPMVRIVYDLFVK